MNASFLQAPSQGILDQITHALASGAVVNGPIFAFDAERQVFVFVHLTGGCVDHWQLEYCANDETYRTRVHHYVEAAEAILMANRDIDAAMEVATGQRRPG